MREQEAGGRGVEGHAWKKGAWANGMDQGRASISTEQPPAPEAGPKPTRRIAQPVLKPGRSSASYSPLEVAGETAKLLLLLASFAVIFVLASAF